MGFPHSCENPIEHMKSVSIILLKALSSEFIKIKHILPFFNMIHANLHFMYELPNANYSNNLNNVIIITLMKKTFLEIGSERIFFVGPIYLSMIINETFLSFWLLASKS